MGDFHLFRNMDSIFTNLLTDQIKEQIAKQAFEIPDEETCGIIVNVGGLLKYIPCQNQADDKRHWFSIGGRDFLIAEKLGEIIAICHSQVKRKDFSGFDLQNSLGHKVLFILFCKDDQKFSLLEKSEKKYSQYLNRKFEIGRQDCFTLLRDFYNNELGIVIEDIARQNLWFEKDRNTIRDGAIREGFKLIEKIEPKELFDVLIFAFNSDRFPVHLGIYLGADEFLHHPRSGGSRIDRIGDYESQLLYLARK